MAKPSTRQGLIDYCLRKLGAPVLEINVADDQIDDLVDDALQLFMVLRECTLSTNSQKKILIEERQRIQTELVL